MQVGGYTDSIGLERGDIVDIEYVGIKQSNGEEFDSGILKATELDPIGLIDGFYRGLLGMKIGQSKQIIVPPSEGYTDPDHYLFGETLIFDVFIIKLVDNIRTDISTDNGDDEGSGTFSRFLDIGLKITGGLFVIGALVYFWNAGNVRTTPKCVHCASIGRSTYAEGKCKKCGNAYCRASFSRGCPNCQANSFIQLKG